MSDVVSLRSLLFEAAKLDDGKQGLGTLRNQARAEFVARGLPTRRLETWKYSDLSQALNETTRPARSPARGPRHSRCGVGAFRERPA